MPAASTRRRRVVYFIKRRRRRFAEMPARRPGAAKSKPSHGKIELPMAHETIEARCAGTRQRKRCFMTPRQNVRRAKHEYLLCLSPRCELRRVYECAAVRERLMREQCRGRARYAGTRLSAAEARWRCYAAQSSAAIVRTHEPTMSAMRYAAIDERARCALCYPRGVWQRCR